MDGVAFNDSAMSALPTAGNVTLRKHRCWKGLGMSSETGSSLLAFQPGPRCRVRDSELRKLDQSITNASRFRPPDLHRHRDHGWRHANRSLRIDD